MPPGRGKLGGRVVSEAVGDGTVDRDRVVVVDQDQIVEAEVARNRDGYSGSACGNAPKTRRNPPS
jgi:diaminopimelate epimerase